MKHILALCLFALSAFAQPVYIIEGDRSAVESELRDAGIQPIAHPDLLSNHTMAPLTERQRASLAGYRVFPAAERLIRGERTVACRFGQQGILPGMAAIIGEGWDGPGKGSATLTYTFGNMSPQWGYDAERNKSDIIAALNKWSAVVQVDFVPGTVRTAHRNIDSYFGTGAHDCFQPFSYELAHAATPAVGTLGEPLAGDVHFSEAYNWATTYKVSSTALHELGHSLGVMHDDTNPLSAMYTYYTGVEQLHPDDIYAIRMLYAARGDTGGAGGSGDRNGRTGTPTILSVSLTGPSTTTAASAILTGAIVGGSAPYLVDWAINGMPQLPFSTGSNFNLTIALPNVGTYQVSVNVNSTAGTGFAVTRIAEDGRAGR